MFLGAAEMNRAFFIALNAFLILAIVSCGDSTDETVESSSGRESTFDLTLGTGRDSFEPLEEGGVLILERGTQGLQHIYVSLRAPIAEGLHLIDLSLTFNNVRYSSPTRVNAPFLSVDGEDFTELVGQFVVVPEPSGVLDVPATLRAQVEPSGGGFAEVVQEVTVSW